MKLLCLLWDDPINSEAQHTQPMRTLHHADSLYRKGFKWTRLCWLLKTQQQHPRELCTAHSALSDPIFTIFFKSRQTVCLSSCYAPYLHTYPPQNKDCKDLLLLAVFFNDLITKMGVQTSSSWRAWHKLSLFKVWLNFLVIISATNLEIYPSPPHTSVIWGFVGWWCNRTLRTTLLLLPSTGEQLPALLPLCSAEDWGRFAHLGLLRCKNWHTATPPPISLD